MNIIQIKDIGNAFLKYSQKTDYCSSCGWVQFTNIFLPNNTHLPVLTFIYQQKTCTKEIQVALRACFCWVVFCFGLFFPCGHESEGSTVCMNERMNVSMYVHVCTQTSMNF